MKKVNMEIVIGVHRIQIELFNDDYGSVTKDNYNAKPEDSIQELVALAQNSMRNVQDGQKLLKAVFEVLTKKAEVHGAQCFEVSTSFELL